MFFVVGISIMVRSPWTGVDSGTNWYCAPGFNALWIVTGYNVLQVGSTFAPAVANGFGGPRPGMVGTGTERERKWEEEGDDIT